MTMNKIDHYMSLPYPLEVIPDTEEGGFTARFPDLPGCLTCAETLEELYQNAQDAKRVWLTAALEDGITIAEPSDSQSLSSYSGQFKLRMPKSLHRSLAVHAKSEGISMNQYCNYLLAMNDTKYSGKLTIN